MSDLQCAATLLVARHGEAEPGEPPAGRPGGLSVTGRDQALALGRSLRDARVSIIYCSAVARAVQTAEIIAAELGVLVRVRDSLGERSTEEPDAQVLARIGEELHAIVDLHRGETVLVVTHGEVIGCALPRLVGNVGAGFSHGRALGDCGVAEVAADGDGWVLRSWAGQRVG